MPEEERLSAVAKRRRLNGNIASVVNTPSDTSRAQSPAKVLTKVIAKSRKSSSSTTDNGEQDVNTFSTLVDRDIVHFSNFREIEHLSDRAIKVRLSKGSKCAILGRYGLWIKEGVIEFFGAKLQASPQLHHVFSHPLFDVPSIIALTNSVEFEVHSCFDVTSFAHGYDFFEWTSQYSEATIQASFFVHGYSDSKNKELLPNVRDFDASGIADANSRASRVKQTADHKRHPSILLCGRQSNGTAMLITSLINHIMTTKHDTRTRQSEQSVVLLDLDLDTPLFAPPGSVSLVHIRSPVLGAPCTHPGVFDSAGQAAPFQILRLQCINRTANTVPARHQLDLLLTFLDHIKQIRLQDFTLIVRANNWIEYMDPDHVATATKQLALDLVICSGSDIGPNTAQLRDIFHTQSGVDAFVNVAHAPSKDPALYVQHQLLVQSYFHFRGYGHGCPQWNVFAIDCDAQHSLWLSYGVKSSLISKILIPGVSITPSDMLDALDSCIVAITLQDSRDTDDLHNPDVQSVRNGTTTRPKGPGAVPKNGAECIGLGIITGFDREQSKICLFTPVLANVFEFHSTQGHKIELVVQRPDREGRFDTGWLQLEGKTMVAGKNPAKFVYRQRLDVRSR